MRTGRVSVLALSVACVAALSGCQLGSLQFRADNRLTFTGPPARHKVTAPVTVSWSMRDFAATGLTGSRDRRSGAFAVFVDSAPMGVGQDLKSLGRDDAGCRRDPRCPDAQFLADRGVFVTTAPSVTLQTLPAQSTGVGDEQHYVNVVLLDGTGHRIGESAWYLPFTSARRSA